MKSHRVVGGVGSGSQSLLCYYGIVAYDDFEISDGTINFDSQKRRWLKRKELQQLETNRDDFPRTDEFLNPSLKCGFQVQEILLQHTDLSNEG
jgi:peptide/nickel transport system ATP-binding protein